MFLSQISRFFQFHNCSVNNYNKWTLQRVVYVTIIGIVLLLQTWIIILVLLIELCIILSVWRLARTLFLILRHPGCDSAAILSARETSSWQAAVSMATCENSLMRATTKLYYRRQQSARHISRDATSSTDDNYILRYILNITTSISGPNLTCSRQWHRLIFDMGGPMNKYNIWVVSRSI